MSAEPIMLSGKMFPDYFLPTTEETLLASSWRWTPSGMVERGRCWTLNISAFHSADGAYSECSLQEILEPNAAQKYYLSPAACRGVLRRAERRGKPLPDRLRQALEAMAHGPE